MPSMGARENDGAREIDSASDKLCPSGRIWETYLESSCYRGGFVSRIVHLIVLSFIGARECFW